MAGLHVWTEWINVRDPKFEVRNEMVTDIYYEFNITSREYNREVWLLKLEI